MDVQYLFQIVLVITILIILYYLIKVLKKILELFDKLE